MPAAYEKYPDDDEVGRHGAPRRGAASRTARREALGPAKLIGEVLGRPVQLLDARSGEFVLTAFERTR